MAPSEGGEGLGFRAWGLGFRVQGLEVVGDFAGLLIFIAGFFLISLSFVFFFFLGGGGGCGGCGGGEWGDVGAGAFWALGIWDICLCR